MIFIKKKKIEVSFYLWEPTYNVFVRICRKIVLTHKHEALITFPIKFITFDKGGEHLKFLFFCFVYLREKHLRNNFGYYSICFPDYVISF